MCHQNLYFAGGVVEAYVRPAVERAPLSIDVPRL